MFKTTPVDIWKLVFGWLDAPDWFRLNRCCKDFQCIVTALVGEHPLFLSVMKINSSIPPFIIPRNAYRDYLRPSESKFCTAKECRQPARQITTISIRSLTNTTAGAVFDLLAHNDLRTQIIFARELHKSNREESRICDLADRFLNNALRFILSAQQYSELENFPEALKTLALYYKTLVKALKPLPKFFPFQHDDTFVANECTQQLHRILCSESETPRFLSPDDLMEGRIYQALTHVWETNFSAYVIDRKRTLALLQEVVHVENVDPVLRKMASAGIGRLILDDPHQDGRCKDPACTMNIDRYNRPPHLYNFVYHSRQPRSSGALMVAKLALVQARIADGIQIISDKKIIISDKEIKSLLEELTDSFLVEYNTSEYIVSYSMNQEKYQRYKKWDPKHAYGYARRFHDDEMLKIAFNTLLRYSDYIPRDKLFSLLFSEYYPHCNKAAAEPLAKQFKDRFLKVRNLLSFLSLLEELESFLSRNTNLIPEITIKVIKKLAREVCRSLEIKKQYLSEKTRLSPPLAAAAAAAEEKQETPPQRIPIQSILKTAEGRLFIEARLLALFEDVSRQIQLNRELSLTRGFLRRMQDQIIYFYQQTEQELEQLKRENSFEQIKKSIVDAVIKGKPAKDIFENLSFFTRRRLATLQDNILHILAGDPEYLWF